MNKRTAPLAVLALSVAAFVSMPIAQAQDTAASTPK